MTNKVMLPSRTLRECEDVVARGQEAVVEMAEALAEIRDRKLYRGAGYSRFDTYCLDRWGLSSSRIYQLLDFAAVKKILPNVSEPVARKVAPAMRANGSLPTRKPGRTVAERNGTRAYNKTLQFDIGRETQRDKQRQRYDQEHDEQNGSRHVWVVVSQAGREAPEVQLFVDEETSLAARDGLMSRGRVWLRRCEVQA